MIRIVTEDGKELDLNSYEFTFKLKQQEIGRITIGGLRSGDCMTRDYDGFHIRYQDGTKYFVNYSWFS